MNVLTELAAAVSLHQEGRVADALPRYASVLAADPSQADAWHLTGLAAHQLGQSETAVKYLSRAIELHPNNAEYHANLAAVLLSRRRFADASQAARRALEFDPNSVVAITHLGVSLRGLNQRDDAERCFRLARLMEPTYVAARIHLADLLWEMEHHDESCQELRACIELEPERVDWWTCLGQRLHARGRLVEADFAYQHAVQQQPDTAPLWMEYGQLQQDLDRLDEARECYLTAAELDPSDSRPWLSLGVLYDARGQWELSLDAYEQAARRRSNIAELWTNRGLALRALDRHAEAVDAFRRSLEVDRHFARAYECLAVSARLGHGEVTNADCENIQQRLEMLDLSDADRSQLNFALATVTEAERDYDAAFGHYSAANRAVQHRYRHTLWSYDPRIHTQYVDRLIEVFSHGLFERLADVGDLSNRLVFVVGMPRSGTSLVEQILASHPDVHGAGELTEVGKRISELVARCNQSHPRSMFPECLLESDPKWLVELAHRHMDRLTEINSTAPRVVDKLPMNYLNLGLIAVLFPQATVLHCRRDPRDTCVSCFRQNFSAPGIASLTSDLSWLGHYYKAYERMMRHWKDVLPLTLRDVVYEQLVDDQATVSREIINACGLPWDERCLNFNATERHVLTASQQQVRQPIYRSSVGSWKRYESHLAPLLESLGALAGDEQPLR
ncbi:MAG: sulfotransferase [Pirellulaceae bacterium]